MGHVQTVEATGYRPMPRVPALETGDRLSRAEFQRRYEAMPHIKKAELVEGVVYMASPVGAKHARAHTIVAGWALAYAAAAPGVEALDNATVILDADNEVQPDMVLRRTVGGASRVNARGYLEGAPELVIEVAVSSASYDLHDKRRVYRRSGVQEYMVWRIDDAALDWWKLEDGEYRPLAPDGSEILRSEAFPGLILNSAALLAVDPAAVLAALRPAP